jgi:hypothetical protein
MVNVGVGVFLKSRCYEIHRGLEGTLLSLPIMRPIRGEAELAIVGSDEPKEVFQAADLGEQSTFHIEEDVGRAFVVREAEMRWVSDLVPSHR